MKKIAVVFGGESSEHDISCISATNIVKTLDDGKYEVHLIGITKEGNWRYLGTKDALSGSDIKLESSMIDGGEPVSVCMDKKKGGFLVGEGAENGFKKIDVWFPVLHGRNGEDGTIQGVFEMSGVPYVGCGVMASAGAMDKVSTKLFADRVGVTQADYIFDVARKNEPEYSDIVKRVEERLSYPVFVKPSNAGSSKGVSKAHDREELIKALALAKENDHRILVEEYIEGNEVECAVLGGDFPEASVVGEILSAAEFYDFDSKYNNVQSKTVVDPDTLSDETKNRLRDFAIKIFKALDGFGLARVDFFVRKSDGEVIFNEINTLPGFTNISMYPMLWEAMGLKQGELLDRLIELAYER